MWKLAVSQLRLHPRRYVAVLLAITLGTMFMAGSLLVMSSAKETTKQMLGATYANADLLITAETDVLRDADSAFYDLTGSLEETGSLHDLDGVEEVYPLINVPIAMVLPEQSDQRGTYDPDSDFMYTTNRPADASLVSAPLTDGGLGGGSELDVYLVSGELGRVDSGEQLALANLSVLSEPINIGA